VKWITKWYNYYSQFLLVPAHKLKHLKESSHYIIFQEFLD